MIVALKSKAVKRSRRGKIGVPLSPKAKAVRKRVAKKPRLPTPTTARERAVQGILCDGSAPSRRDISPAHVLELIDRYPTLYRLANAPSVQPCEPMACYGFTVGDGWFSIIDRLSAKLAVDPNVVAVQVKEKYGMLKFYVDAIDGKSDPNPIERFYAERLDASKESKRTCEICGVRGRHIERGKWWSVRCKPCEWLDVMEEACRLLVECSKGWTTPRSPRGIRLDAARRHIQHIGEAASLQSKERRARLPAIPWKRLDAFRAVPVVLAMSAAKVYGFIRDEVPALAKALR